MFNYMWNGTVAETSITKDEVTTFLEGQGHWAAIQKNQRRPLPADLAE